MDYRCFIFYIQILNIVKISSLPSFYLLFFFFLREKDPRHDMMPKSLFRIRPRAVGQSQGLFPTLSCTSHFYPCFQFFILGPHTLPTPPHPCPPTLHWRAQSLSHFRLDSLSRYFYLSQSALEGGLSCWNNTNRSPGTEEGGGGRTEETGRYKEKETKRPKIAPQTKENEENPEAETTHTPKLGIWMCFLSSRVDRGKIMKVSFYAWKSRSAMFQLKVKTNKKNT